MRAGRRALFDNLPGQLLLLTVSFSAVILVLAYLPAASAFRTQWLLERVDAAHIAALAADVAPPGSLQDEQVAALLRASGAIHVARVREGINELVLYGGPVQREMVENDFTVSDNLDRIWATLDTLYGPEGRYLRVRARPMSQADEIIDVILIEAPLKQELYAFSRRFLAVSIGLTIVLAGLIYLILFRLFVRPMRRLAGEMMRFQADPSDPARMITPGKSRNEIGQAEQALAEMQSEIRQAFHQRERLAALGAAVAKINHDLRNILASAQLVSDSLAANEDPRVAKMGERLVRAVDRGVRLAEDVLAYGRAEEGAPERSPLEIRALVEEAARDAMASEGEVDWRNEVDIRVLIDADPDHAYRIFLNLFRNALQAMQSESGEKRLAARALIEGEAVRIEVRDSGPGVPQKARDHLFQAFGASSRKGGTGLGLSISRELARAHGGEVDLVETGPQGSVFIVVLPKAGPKA